MVDSQFRFVEMLGAVVQKHYDQIQDVVPKDGGGIWIWPGNCTVDRLIVDMTGLLNAGGWFVSCRRSTCFFVEPLVTARLVWQPFVFHVSDSVNRASILSAGLQRRTGGNTSMNRTYPPRIFFSLDLISAFQFVDFQCRADASGRSRRREDMDLFRVRLPEEVQLHKDPLFPSRAAWIDADICKDLVSVVPDWLAEHQWFREKGYYGTAGGDI